MTYVPYTIALTAVDAAHISLAEARAVADAYAEQVITRKASWEAGPTPESFGHYQDAVAQYRAACDTARVADANLTNALQERAGRAA